MCVQDASEDYVTGRGRRSLLSHFIYHKSRTVSKVQNGDSRIWSPRAPSGPRRYREFKGSREPEVLQMGPRRELWLTAFKKYQKLIRTVYILSNKFFECFNNSNSLMAVLRPEIINFYSIRKVKQCWVRSIFGWVAAEQVALSLPLNNRNL